MKKENEIRRLLSEVKSMQNVESVEEAIKKATEMIEKLDETRGKGENPERGRKDSIEYCEACDHGEMCAWYPHEGCVFRTQKEQSWIPVRYHEITEEERKKEGFPDDRRYLIDSVLPEDGQEILVSIRTIPPGTAVDFATCAYEDEGAYLEEGYDWIEDVTAWMPIPEPYKEG